MTQAGETQEVMKIKVLRCALEWQKENKRNLPREYFYGH